MVPLSILLAAAAPAAAEPPPHTYLRGAAPREACGEQASGGDVVVCGRKEAEEAYRLRPLIDGDRYEPKPLRAELGLGGGKTLGVGLQTKELTPGQKTQRVMVTVGVPF
jgi:hypothetical protein